MTGITKGYAGSILTSSSKLTGDTIDVSKSGLYSKTITEPVQFKTVKAATTQVATFSLMLENGGSAAVTWADNFKWAEGSAPDLSVSGLDILTFLTNDRGATWYGILSLASAQ